MLAPLIIIYFIWCSCYYHGDNTVSWSKVFQYQSLLIVFCLLFRLISLKLTGLANSRKSWKRISQIEAILCGDISKTLGTDLKQSLHEYSKVVKTLAWVLPSLRTPLHSHTKLNWIKSRHVVALFGDECLLHFKTSICQSHIFCKERYNYIYHSITTSMLEQLVLRYFSRKDLVVCALFKAMVQASHANNQGTC